MKMRNIPFGYRMENGKIIFHPTESQAVKDIFSDYLGGQSLLKIAQSLNERQVEYLPGTTAPRSMASLGPVFSIGIGSIRPVFRRV